MNFPSDPDDGQIFTVGSRSWQYDAGAGVWEAVAASSTPATFEVYDVTNAQRLAGTRADDATPLASGDVVRVTDQGDRIEKYLGGADFSNANWLVLDDTAEIIFDPTGGPSSTFEINGVEVETGNVTNVGWVNVRQGIPVGDVDGSFNSSSASSTGVLISQVASAGYYNAGFDSFKSGSFLLLSEELGHLSPLSRLLFPAAIPPRSTVTVGFGA